MAGINVFIVGLQILETIFGAQSTYATSGFWGFRKGKAGQMQILHLASRII
jgi:hypothetical protein